MPDTTLRAALDNDNPQRIVLWQRGVGWLSDDEALAVLAALVTPELSVSVEAALRAVAHHPHGCNGLHVELGEAIEAALRASVTPPPSDVRRVQVYDGEGECVMDVGVIDQVNADWLVDYIGGSVDGVDVYDDPMPKADSRSGLAARLSEAHE